MKTFQLDEKLDESQKRYFAALCATGNITQAAQALYLSRQGLSKSMRSLEERLGARLLIRGGKGVELTEAGQILLSYIQAEEQLWSTCLADIRSATGLHADVCEPVRIGLLSMYYGYDQKRDLLVSFQDDPRLSISIIDGDHDFFWHEIAAGAMEFAITVKPPDDWGLLSIALDNSGLSVLLSADDPLAQKEQIDFTTDLRGKTLLQTSPYKAQLYDAVMRKHGIATERIHHDKNLMLAQLVARRAFFIIQTQYAPGLAIDQASGQIDIKPLINAPITMDTVFVSRPDLGPLARVVARKVIAPFGKEAEFDTLFAPA